ncbi:hypothetical protein PPACK8108_LOCUS21912 [Phakopsora pachyrhizi]|uniref:Dilute domain-containing protein n=1 Tax=Phakopsora pachyrhizi TaxID=170000 RepID=A0AAV0BLH9_PHAPC|nr:hypothetical protein PPACK8108_LOCUS21912 [Phakopsora pachyrhizi]
MSNSNAKRYYQYQPDPAYIDPLIALAPTPHNLSRLVNNHQQQQQQQPTSSSSPDDSIRRVFTSAFLRASSIGDSDLLEWLLAKPSHSHNHVEHCLSPPPPHSTLRSINTQKPINSNSDQKPSLSSTVSNLLPPGRAREWVDLDARDEDQSPAIVLAAAFGHPESVRALVDGIGGDVVDSRDSVGWTALHWAARNGDFTIVSYLLNHGASTRLVSFSDTPSLVKLNLDSTLMTSNSSISLTSPISSSPNSQSTSSPSSSTQSSSHPPPPLRTRNQQKKTRGLRPIDLVKPNQDGENIRHILKLAEEAKYLYRRVNSISSSSSSSASNSRPNSRASSTRFLRNHRSPTDHTQVIELIRLSSTLLGIDPKLFERTNSDDHRNRKLSRRDGNELLRRGTAVGYLSSTEDWEDEQFHERFDWNGLRHDQMLVFSFEDLDQIFEVVINCLEPRQNRQDRFTPVNLLFLFSRFAGHLGFQELLENLLLGSIDKIEEVILSRQENMANSAFWLFNSITMLYYLEKDPVLKIQTTSVRDHLRELINEIYVFIIREAERRLDKIIDSCLLDHEPLRGLGDVEFEPEGSWSFVKAFTSKRTRNNSARASIPSFRRGSDHSTPPSTPAPSSTSTGDSFQILLRSNPSPSNLTITQNREPIDERSAHPRKVSNLLESVLFLLQAYEIHPLIIIQSFSQIFYWLTSELFNRIISRRKYLCRSRSVQIQENLKVIRSFVSSSRLPPLILEKFLTRLDCLLRWIERLSSIESFDELIGLISREDFKGHLNPIQILKSYKDYRFEVGESRLGEECRAYLIETQQCFERLKAERRMELERSEKSLDQRDDVQSKGDEDEDRSAEGFYLLTKEFDRYFEREEVEEGDDGLGIYRDFEPVDGSENLGELVDSRHMVSHFIIFFFLLFFTKFNQIFSSSYVSS